MSGLNHSHLCGCCRPASGHTVLEHAAYYYRHEIPSHHCHAVRGVSERVPAINQGSHHIQNSASSIKEVWVFVLGFFMFVQLFSLVLDP